MKYFSFILLTLLSFSINGQDHYVTYIDIDNKPQIASQMMLHNDKIYLSSILGCGEEYKQCSGLLNVNKEGKILRTLSIDSFSNNSDGLILYNDTILMSGEINMGKANGFTTFVLDKNLDLIKQINYNSEDTLHSNYICNNALLIENKIVVSGSSFNDGYSEQIGQIFTMSDCKIDTNILIEVSAFSTRITNMHSTSLNDIILYISDTASGIDKDSIHLIKLDTSFNQTFEWSMEVPRSHIPRGCVTQDDDMIITVPNYTWSSIRDIWSISQIGQVNWRYKWPDTKGSRNILRIEEATNQDLFVMGEIVTPNLFNDARPTAFVMRLDAEGNEIWRRYFRSENEHRALSGYVSDLEELENGDLLLTGKSTRILYGDGEERLDQDIFWARIGGDGCINGDCDEVYLISNTNDLLPAIVDISIHPNPTVDGLLTIDVNDHSVQSAWIYDLSGQLIIHQKLEYGSTSISLEGNNSIYLIRIVDDEGRLVHSEKVIKL